MERAAIHVFAHVLLVKLFAGWENEREFRVWGFCKGEGNCPSPQAAYLTVSLM